MTLQQAADRYLGTLPQGQRELAAGEINAFVRRIGPSRPLDRITKTDVDRYQQALQEGGGDATARVEALKAFLSDLKNKRLTETNLGAVLRVRRKGGSGKSERIQNNVIELTQEGYDQLQAEVRRLEEDEVPSVRQELADAYQDRDFRENAPYDAAKRRLGELTGRINDLKSQLAKARIVEVEVSTERAGMGSRVVLHDLEFGENLTYTLVGPGEVNTREQRISIQSPVGAAIKDRTVGDIVEVDIPTGRARYRIERIERPE